MYRVREVSATENPWLHTTVEKLSLRWLPSLFIAPLVEEALKPLAVWRLGEKTLREVTSETKSYYS